jgi:cation/acetate symporter
MLLADGLWWGLQPVSAGVFGVLLGVMVTVVVSAVMPVSLQKT